MIPWPSCAKRATGVAAAADLLFALDAVPAAMEAALNRFGRPTTSADAVRRQALRHAARLRDVQEVWAMALASLPEPDAAADRVGECGSSGSSSGWERKARDGAAALRRPR